MSSSMTFKIELFSSLFNKIGQDLIKSGRFSIF